MTFNPWQSALATLPPPTVCIAEMQHRLLYSGLGLTCAVAAAATELYVASYAGPVFHLSLTGGGSDGGSGYGFEELGSTLECGLNPAWLELDDTTGTLLCSNEAYTIPNAGSLASFSKETLGKMDNLTTDYGPAQSTFYAPNRLGLAHYAGGAVSVIDTSDPSNVRELQSFHYFMDTPGPNTTLQDKPYPHGIVVDPTGKYVVVLDRGADCLRTYSVGWDSRLVERGVYEMEKGIGPRHGVFVRGTARTFFYVLGELTNSVLGFEVLDHDDDTIDFRQFYKDSTYQTGFGDMSGVALPSEIAAVDGGKHIVLSVRNDNRQVYAGEPSDTIASFEVDFDTGDLKLVDLTASGGKWPRSFAITIDGTKIAVANQYTVPGRVVVFARDPETGVIWDGETEALAIWETNVTLPDGQSISHVLWDD